MQTAALIVAVLATCAACSLAAYVLGYGRGRLRGWIDRGKVDEREP